MLTLFKSVCLGVRRLVDYENRAGGRTPWAHRDIKPAYVFNTLLAVCS